MRNVICAVIDSDGYLVAVDSPQTRADCPLVIQDFESYQSEALMPWHLDGEQGAQVALAVGLLWCVGFGLRTLIQAARN